MQTHQILLNGKQYSELERVLRGNCDLSRKLAENKAIDGYELFSTLVFELEDLIENGCGIDEFGMPILKTITAQIYPEDEEYFVRQIGESFVCDDHFALKIELNFSSETSNLFNR